MINVLISGCNGKMGQVVASEIDNIDSISVICGFDRTENNTLKFPVYTNTSDIKENPDIIIDFSMPIASFKILDFAKENKIPVVLATTGFSEEETEKIKGYSKFIPVFKSANMSYETNVMCKIVANLAKLLSDADIEIVETHHNRKVDAPSGTALLLADSINKSLDNSKYYEYNRHDKKEKRNKQEIGIHSIRGGTEVGKHSVLFFGENESFELTHSVTSRAVFAKGAIKAAEFLINKSIGFYDMNDLLNI